MAATSRQQKTTATPNKLSTNKQAKLSDVMFRAANKRVPQATVDKLVINFICEGLQPFVVVEQPAFKELVTTLQPQATVCARICEAADHMKVKHWIKSNLLLPLLIVGQLFRRVTLGSHAIG